MDAVDPDTPVYVISVAAELAQMHPQTLRQYDRMGLVVPTRRNGSHRRYSQRDVARLRRIQELSNQGVSLEGIRRMMEMEAQVRQLRSQIAELQDAVGYWRSRVRRPQVRVFTAASGGEIYEGRLAPAGPTASRAWQEPLALTALGNHS